MLTKQPLRSPTGAWRRGVRVLSARGGENECQSMSEPGAERQHCTSNSVSTSEQISAYRLYFATERRLVLIGTCNWYNSQRTTRPGKLCLTRGDRLAFFPRGATLLRFSCFAVIFALLFRKVSVVGIKGQLNLPRDFFKQRKCSECLDRDCFYDPVGTRLMFLWRNLVLSDCLMSDLEPDLTHPNVAVSCSRIARHLLLLLFAFCCVEIELRWWCATLLFHINRSPIRYHVSLARNDLIAAIILVTLYGAPSLLLWKCSWTP